MNQKHAAKPSYTSDGGFRGLLAATFIVTAGYVLDSDLINGVSIGGLNFVSLDLVCGLLGAIVTVRYARRLKFTSLELVFFLLLALTAVEFIRGAMAYGTAAALDFRPTMQWLVIIAFTAQTRGLSRSKIATCLAIPAAGTLFVYFGRIIGFITWSFHVGYSEFRFVDAGQALAVAFFSLSCLALSLYGTKGRAATFYGVAGLGAMVFFIAMMHRTVWVSAFTGIGILILANIRYRMMNMSRFLMFLLIAIAAVIAIAAAIAASPILQAAIFEVSKSNSTVEWRVQGWQDLLSELNLYDLIAGKSFGANYGRWINGGYVVASSHNFYIEKLWQLGVFGLLLYLLFLGWIAIALLRLASRSGIATEDRAAAVLLLAEFIATLVYFIPYSEAFSNAVVVGLGMAFVLDRAPAMIPLRISFSTSSSRALRIQAGKTAGAAAHKFP